MAGLERREEHVGQQVARIVRTDAPPEVAVDRPGVPIEDLAEPSRLVQRGLDEVSI